MKINKKTLSIILVLCVLLSALSTQVVIAKTTDKASSAVSATEESVSAGSYGLVDNVQDGQILQCWNWSYNGIKNNMKKIAEQGFSAVQTTPIQTIKESTIGKSMKGSWWVYYQPSNFFIDNSSQSALGNKADFVAMCEEAHKYGVKVIVDAVLNHMANTRGNDLSNTIPDDIRNDSSCWHSITQNTSNWNDRYDITHNCMDGLPDLNTGNKKIQNYEIAFLKECIDAGVDGFRFDGAKHIEVPADRDGVKSDFWPTVLGATTSYAQQKRNITPYYYGEVLDSTGGVAITGYTEYMSVTDKGCSNDIRNKVGQGNAGGAITTNTSLGSALNKTVQWDESHDTYADGSSSGTSESVLNKTWAIIGSKAQVCGMYLARPKNVNDAIGTASVTAWGNKEVQAVNQFKNYFVGQSEYLSASGSIAYNERGTTGVVLVNCSGTSQNVSVKANKMQNGTYKDAITGNTFTVSGGQISGQIGSTGIAVVYNAKPKVSNTISQAGGKFKSDTLSLTLGLENATSGTYQIDNGAVQSYTGSKTITIGSGVAFGSTITVKLTATGSGETTSVTYTFQKVDPNAMRTIMFNDGDVYLWDTANWSKQNCYSWVTGGQGSIAWPGTQMTAVDTFGGHKLYKFTLPTGETNVIFNDGSTKTDDLAVQSGFVVFDNSKNSWVDANSIDEDVVAQKGGSVTPTPTTTDSQQTSDIYKYGDVNLDGVVNISDATTLQKAVGRVASLNDVQKKAADVDGSGTVDIADGTVIQKLSVKKILKFDVGETFTFGGGNVTQTVTTTQPVADGVTITLIDGTPQKWLADAQANFVLEDTSTGKKYEMTGGSGTWTVTIPKSVKNIKICRNDPVEGGTWNSWTTTVSGTTYTANGNESGSWS